MVYETHNAAETYALGKRLGEDAQPGEVIALTGDLGAGKTVLTQGIAAGLGITGIVNSPTFTILQVHEGGRLPLYHFDVYRLGDVGEMDEIGCEEYFYGDGVCVVEWAERIGTLLPKRHKEIRMEREMREGADYRKITVTERQETEADDI